MKFTPRSDLRVPLQLVTLFGTVILVVSTTIAILYTTSFEQRRQGLIVIVNGQARLMEAVARFDELYSSEDVPGGAAEATLGQIRDAHTQFTGFGTTGEFTLAERRGDQIHFVLKHRHPDAVNDSTADEPVDIPMSSENAIPMQRALRGESGTIVGRDYRGVMVLAAFEPVARLDMGIVAKIDMAELRAPFIRASAIAFGLTLLLTLLGGGFLYKVGDRMLRQTQESEARSSAVLEMAADGIITIDTKGIVLSANSAASKIFNYPQEKLLGQNVRILVPPPDQDKHDGYLAAYMETGIKNIIGKPRGVEGLRSDNTTFPMSLRISEVMVRDQHLFTAIVRDLTQEVAMERQLRQNQKIQALGTLAGGIAHDFNNILQSLLGFTQIAKSQIKEEGGLIEECLDEIEVGGKRAAALVDQILAYSRSSEIERSPVMMEPLLKEAVKFLQSTLPSTIDIQVHIEKDCGLVMADPTQIHQIIMNLCTNGTQAMEESGGTLHIDLGTVTLNHDRDLSLGALAHGRYIRLAVKDAGHGMDDDTLERVFDPFYTTKDVGKGTGLGLATVQGIVGDMGGAINVETTLGGGTTFEVFLPSYGAGRRLEDFVSTPSQAVARGRGKILLVDDDETVTRMTTLALNNSGFDVVGVTDSQQAIDIFKSASKLFDVVISDLTMPKMTGIQLATKLHSINSDVPILLVTGIVDKVDKVAVDEIGIKEILKKPIDINHLIETINRYVADGVH